MGKESSRGCGNGSAPREQWATRTGFILATIGSAAGMGNVWRFSYVAGENGGAAFLIVYLVFVVLIGLPLVIAELAIGRTTQADAVGAFRRLAPRKPWVAGGYIAVAGVFLILGYYAVIAGWSLKYFVGAVSGALWREAGAGYGGYFKAFIADPWQPLLWHGIMIGLTVAFVAGGVQSGIERLNRVLMPLLAAILIALAVFGATRRGAGAGLAFLFAPDWAALLKPDLYLAAMGQAFFSLGVGMALFITYGSYLSRKSRLPHGALAIVAGDSLLAIVAGVAIFGAVFAAGMDPAAGPELAFITLPQTFLSMPGGVAVGAMFFLLLSAAALTSMVSMLEVAVAYWSRVLGLGRTPVASGVGLISFCIGVPASLGFGLLSDARWQERGILDSMDYVAVNVILPTGGLIVALFVGWGWGRAQALSESDLGGGVLGRSWLWLLRTAVPALIILIFLRAVGLL